MFQSKSLMVFYHLIYVLMLPNAYSINWGNSAKNTTEKYINKETNSSYSKLIFSTNMKKINGAENRSLIKSFTYLNKGTNDETKRLVIKELYTFQYIQNVLSMKQGTTQSHAVSNCTKGRKNTEIVTLVGNSQILKHRNTRQIYRPDCQHLGICDDNKGKQIPNCYCDSDCINFNDCCWDFSYNSTSLTTNRTIPKFEFMSCQALSIPEMNDVDNEGFIMVSKCPQTSLFESTVIKCIFGSNKELPVTDQDGITYKNSDCARCHGVTSYEYWNILVNLVRCDNLFFSLNTTDINKKVEILEENNCEIYRVPPTLFLDKSLKFPRYCFMRPTESFSQKTKCRSYMNTVKTVISEDPYKGVYVRNFDCLSPLQRYTCVRAINVYDLFTNTVSKVTMLPPLTVLFNFKTKQLDSCHDRKDSVGTSWNANCHKETILNYILKIKVTLESIGMASTSFFHRAMLMFYNSLPVMSYNMKILNYHSYGKVLCVIDSVASITNCCNSSTELNIQFGIPLTVNQIERIKLAMLNMKFVYKETQGSTSNKQFIVKRIMHDQNKTCDLKAGLTRNEQFFLKLQEQYTLTNRLFIKTYPSHMNAEQFPNKSICKVHIVLKNETTGNIVDDIIEMKILNWTVSSLKLEGTKTKTENSIQIPKTILTYVTMSISTVTLFVTVGIYIYFGISKSLAGNVCTNVMITLITADLLFMFGIGAIDNQLICSVLGMILHYIWLCVFNWISLYTLLVTKILITIDKNPAFQIDQTIKKKCIYILGYGLPLLMVVPCIVLEKFPEFLIGIKYGGSICFLSGYLANIIFFTGPIVGSLLFNVVLLMLALKMLRKYNYAVINKSTKKTIQYVITFVKLCLISGVFWIFGILSEAIRSEFFDYLFIIIAGSQGLIVCLCFLTSFHVCALCTTSQNTTQVAISSQ